MLDPVIHKMITYVQNLEEKDLKDKVRRNERCRGKPFVWFAGVERGWEASEGSSPCTLATLIGWSGHFHRQLGGCVKYMVVVTVPKPKHIGVMVKLFDNLQVLLEISSI